MTLMIKLLAGGAGLAAIASAAPAAAQYYQYNNGYGYNYNSYNTYGTTQAAASRCTSAVQARLNNRGSTGILGALFGINTQTSGRVLNVSQVTPRRNAVRVTGYATSGRYAYNRYGYGAYGTLGANYTPDLRFRCDVDYRGYVRDVDIMRR
jgi:hypothetical protein